MTQINQRVIRVVMKVKIMKLINNNKIILIKQGLLIKNINKLLFKNLIKKKKLKTKRKLKRYLKMMK